MNYLLETLLVSFIILVSLFFFLKKRDSRKPFKYESKSSTNVDPLHSENEFLKDQFRKLQETFANEQELISLQRVEFLKKERLLDEQLKNLEEKLSLETENRRKILSQKKSSEVRLGHIAETLAPFLDQFEFDPENCTFLGKPIDYISFGKDEITLIEIKSGKSQLNQKQRHIRNLVENKSISWKEIRIQ